MAFAALEDLHPRQQPIKPVELLGAHQAAEVGGLARVGAKKTIDRRPEGPLQRLP